MDQEVLKKQLEQAANAALYQQLQMRFQHMNRYLIEILFQMCRYMSFGFERYVCVLGTLE